MMLLIQNFDYLCLIGILNWCYRTFSHPFFNNVCGGIERALYGFSNFVIPIIFIFLGWGLLRYSFDAGIIIMNIFVNFLGATLSIGLNQDPSTDVFLFVISLIIPLFYFDQSFGGFAKLGSLFIFGYSILINLSKILSYLSNEGVLSLIELIENTFKSFF